MSGPQFIHIETYARSVSVERVKRERARAKNREVFDRKLTVEEICGEAARLPGHHPHVDEAEPPVLLYGISPDLVPALLEERVEEANAAIKAKKAAMERGTRVSGTKAIRSDTHVLLTMVASYPMPWIDEATGADIFADQDNRALLEKWQRLNIKWAKRKARQLGFDLVSVVRHDDEAHPHLHFIGIPRNERMEARRCHPGYIAKEALQPEPGEGDKPAKKRRDRAYSDAMRSFQDDYYEAVSIDSGLLRTGPNRARLPGAVYKADKALARARGMASVRADQLADENERAKRELDETQQVLDRAGQEAVEAIVLISDLERDRDTIEQVVSFKAAEVQDLQSRMGTGDSLLAEIEAEQDALRKAKDERLRLEADTERVQAERARAADDLRREREEVAEERRQHAAEKEKQKGEADRQRQTLDAMHKELDAVMDGVAAYAEGRLRYVPENPAQPFILSARRGGSDMELRDRLEAVKPRLVPLIRRLDQAMTERATKLHIALSNAVAGWSSGLLKGVGEPGDDGRPTFLILPTAEGNRLRAAIEPFREAVARVLSSLPDRGLLASVTAALRRLQPRLTYVEQEEARELEINAAQLEKHRSSGRG